MTTPPRFDRRHSPAWPLLAAHLACSVAGWLVGRDNDRDELEEDE